MKYKPSQYLKHALYGHGVVAESDTDRTTIDFENFGKKKFVTSMLQVELLAGAAPKPVRTRRRKAVAAVAVAAE